MDKKLSEKGMFLIAPEVQGSSKDAIEKIVEDHGIEYTITSGLRGPNLSRGIPHMMVFDVSGKLIFAGHPANPDAERTIRMALRDVKEESADDEETTNGPLVSYRIWTNAEGNQMPQKAQVDKVEENTVHFRMSNGRSISYALDKLSADDQEIIREALKARQE